VNARQIIRKALMATLGIGVAAGLICGARWARPAEAAPQAAASGIASAVAVQAKKCVVAFDPGHGGRDAGAAQGGIREKDVNWKIANLAADILRDNGFGAVLSRAENQNPGFDERIGAAYRANAVLMVSIHTNSYTDGGPQGTEAWYQPKGASENRRLAQLLADTVSSRAGTSNRGVYIGKAPFPYGIPSALIELAFLSNEDERDMLVKRPDIFAHAIAEAVVKFTEGRCSSTYQPASGFKNGEIVYLKTLGQTAGPRWLEGRSEEGQSGLALSMEKDYPGSFWQLAELGGGAYGLRWLGQADGRSWLEGHTVNGTVWLAASMDGDHSGTHWQLVDLGGGAYGLKCLGESEGPRWLEGRTGNGTVGLAPDTEEGYSGTHWEITIVR
jgi:N-acetylmuramoyl-L-alanine amidase